MLLEKTINRSENHKVMLLCRFLNIVEVSKTDTYLETTNDNFEIKHDTKSSAINGPLLRSEFV